MLRRTAAVLAVLAPLGLLGCQPATVSVGFTPQVGDRYEYRYEIDATVTRALEGQEPEVVQVDTELVAVQEVQARTRSGARIRLELTREGGVPRSAVVLVDRAGSLEGVELVDDLDAAVFGVAGGDSLVPTHLDGPPDRPLAPGDRWTVSDGPRRGTGRLDRLGVIDGEDVAVVTTSATEDLARSLTAAESATRVRGTLRSGATTSYDLVDGAIRRSRSWSRGSLEAELAPPAGVDADAVRATIGYDVSVVVTRVR
jgi:hypothetical protein